MRDARANVLAVRRLEQAAATCVSALFIYYEVYRWVPLGRWNWQFSFPVVNDQFYPDLVIGALLLVVAWSFFAGKRVGMWAGCALLGLWVAVHSFDWWIPYAKSLPENIGRYRFYSAHTQILPVIGNHYPPDGGHAVLDFILFPTWVVVMWATVRGFVERRSVRRSAAQV